MNKLATVFIICILFTACIFKKELYYSRPQYLCDDGHKNCYLVDSIYIKDPIHIVTKEGREFTMSRKVFEEYNGEKDFFYTHPDIYLSYWLFPDGIKYDKNTVSRMCFDYSGFQYTTEEGIEIYSYKTEVDYFILLLVNGAYYNNIFYSFDIPTPPLKLKNLTFSYYKVVIPVCKR
jgi:hypothetical protein